MIETTYFAISGRNPNEAVNKLRTAYTAGTMLGDRLGVLVDVIRIQDTGDAGFGHRNYRVTATIDRPRAYLIRRTHEQMPVLFTVDDRTYTAVVVETTGTGGLIIEADPDYFEPSLMRADVEHVTPQFVNVDADTYQDRLTGEEWPGQV